jgi:hypothetical protein
MLSNRTAVTDIRLPLAPKGSTADSHALPSTRGFFRGCCGGGYCLLLRTFGLHFRSGLTPVIVGATATPAILLPQRIGSFSDTVLDRLSRICHNCYSFQGELSLSGGLYALQIMLGVCVRHGLPRCPQQPVPRRRRSSTIRARSQTNDRYPRESESGESRTHKEWLMAQDPAQQTCVVSAKNSRNHDATKRKGAEHPLAEPRSFSLYDVGQFGRLLLP